MKKSLFCVILGSLLISQLAVAQRLSNALNRKIVAQNSSTTSPPVAGAPAPTITSVTLTSSNSVTINGTNLTGVTAVKFGPSWRQASTVRVRQTVLSRPRNQVLV